MFDYKKFSTTNLFVDLQGVKVNKQPNVYFVGASDLAPGSKAGGIQYIGWGKFFGELIYRLTFDVNKVPEHLKLL